VIVKCTRLVAAVGWSLAALSAAGCAGEGEGVRPGHPAPRFALKARDGSVVRSDSFKGQVVLLNFWSTGCAACVRELPELQELDDSSRARVVGIALDPEGWGAVQPFVERHQVRFCVLVGDEELFQRYDGYSIPYSLLLDQSQRVVKVYRGPVTRETVEKDIQAMAGKI
jgi:peroxiredoxin